MKELDDIDVAILRALQADGRQTNVALAKSVGYAANLDPERVGLGLLVFIEVSIARTSQDAFDQFRDAAVGIPEIQECHMVAGGFDYLLKVRVPDMRAYRAFLGEVLSQIPGIRETRTYPVMEVVKETHVVDLGHLARKRGGENQNS
jgi:Lrp/AsnC family transcriptional regulator, leucine-responsive regulatory protein